MADALLGGFRLFLSALCHVVSGASCTCWNISVSAELGEKRPLENHHSPPPPHLILGRSPVGELEFKNFKCQEWISKARGCVCDYINKIFITFLL